MAAHSHILIRQARTFARAQYRITDRLVKITIPARRIRAIMAHAWPFSTEAAGSFATATTASTVTYAKTNWQRTTVLISS